MMKIDNYFFAHPCGVEATIFIIPAGNIVVTTLSVIDPPALITQVKLVKCVAVSPYETPRTDLHGDRFLGGVRTSPFYTS
jgi:hypothetical protein